MSVLSFTDTSGTDKTVQVSEAEIEREFGKQDAARVFVNRTRISESNISRGDTEMFLLENESQSVSNALFGGLLRDVNRQGAITEVLLDSFERLAEFATPTPGGQRFENVDGVVIVDDALQNIDTISQGVVENVSSSPVSMLFSHSTQAKKIRSVSDVTGADIRYNPDKTLDYLSSRGSDKSASVELSPTNQNIIGDFKAEKKGGKKDVTHLRVLGAGEGRHQRELNFVPADDTESYDNKRTYVNNDWQDGDQTKWNVISNKDITDIDALEQFGQNKIEDFNSDGYIDVTTTVRGIELRLGDVVQVVNADEEIDTSMKVVSLVERVLPTGTEYDVVLSTRKESRRKDSEKDRQDIQRYNKSLQGTAVPINASGGRQPVNSSNNYELKLYYPDEVKFEHRLNVRVMGLAYRAYSEGVEAGGNHTHDVNVTHPTHSHEVTVTHPSHSHNVTVNHPSHSHDVTVNHPTHSHSVTVNHPQHSHTVTVTHPSHNHSVTVNHPSHNHRVNVTHPNHSHNVTVSHPSHSHSISVSHPSHDHGIDLDFESGQTTAFTTFRRNTIRFYTTKGEVTIQPGRVISVEKTIDSTFNEFGLAITCFAEINSSEKDQVRLAIEAGTQGDFAREELERDISVIENFSEVAASATTTTFTEGQTTAQATIENMFFPDNRVAGNIDVDTISSRLIVEDMNHRHDIREFSTSTDTFIPDTDDETSTAALGETETATSTNELGDTTTETSFNALGDTTSETTDAELGDTISETSSKELGDTTSETTDTELGTTETTTSTSALGQTETTTSTTELGSTNTQTSSSELGTTSTESTVANQGGHTHPTKAGIIERFNGNINFPSDCDVIVNGTRIETSFGDGTGRFEEDVEIKDKLLPGQVNTIEVTSGSLGHLQVFVEGDVYRQIKGDG